MENRSVGATAPNNDPSHEHINNNDTNDFDNFFDRLLHAHDDDTLNMYDQIMKDGIYGDLTLPLSNDTLDKSNSLLDQVSLEKANVQVNDNDNHHGEQGNASVLNCGNAGEQGSCSREEPFQWEEVLHNSTVPDDPCFACQVLREITHNDGTHIIKFGIHGAPGLISHGILENHDNSSDGIATIVRDYQLIDFSTHTFEAIKQHLLNYFEEQRQRGRTVLQEPLSCYYEALCIGYNWVAPARCDSDFQMTTVSVREPHAQGNQGMSSSQAPGVSQPNHPEVPHNTTNDSPRPDDQVPTNKTKLSIQRERTKAMTLQDFAKYFDLTIEDAAKQLRLCPTVIKKKLRSFGIQRWPQRKVTSIKMRITKGGEGTQELQKQLDDILNGDSNAIIEAINKK